jgi:hypothetical protein
VEAESLAGFESDTIRVSREKASANLVGNSIPQRPPLFMSYLSSKHFSVRLGVTVFCEYLYFVRVILRLAYL